MLSRTHRLRASEVAALHKSGKRIGSRHLSLVSLPASKTACAVVAGKSAGIGSVARNRIRRRIYAILRRSLLPKMATSAQMAIGVQKSAFSLSMEELDRELTSLFSRARLIA